MKYYFDLLSSEICYPESFYQEEMIKEELESIDVFEAIPIKIKGFFWCKKLQSVGDNDYGYCGNECKHYKPRNGIKGCCKHYSNILYEHGEKVILTKK